MSTPEQSGAKITEEIPVTLAEAFRRLETAARKYVPDALDPKRTPAWNNHDGTRWPELRSALAAVEEAKRG